MAGLIVIAGEFGHKAPDPGGMLRDRHTVGRDDDDHSSRRFAPARPQTETKAFGARSAASLFDFAIGTGLMGSVLEAPRAVI